MTKNVKRCLFTLLAAGMAIISVLFAACTPEEDYGDPATDGYQVTFLYPDGSPVKGTDYAGSGPKAPKTYATLKDENGNNLTLPEQGLLNDYGQANFNYKVPGEYTVFLGNIPDGYSYETIKTTADRAKYTVNLTRNVESYEITVQYPDGSAYANVGAKLVKDETEYATATTNAQGIATFQSLPADNYDVIIDIPDNYGYNPVKTPKKGNAVTVKLYDVHLIDFKDANKMTTEEVDEWANDLNGLVTLVNTSVDNYKYVANVKGEEEYIFAIKAQWTGVYNVTARTDRDADGNKITGKTTNYNLHFYGDAFDKSLEHIDMNITGNMNGGNNMVHLNLEEGQTYFMSVSSLDGNDYDFTFIVSYERTPYTLSVAEPGEYTLKFDQIDHAVIEFKPSDAKGGMYSVTSSTTDYDPMLVCYSAATKRPINTSSEDTSDLTGTFAGCVGNDNGGEGNNFLYVEDVMRSMVGNTYYFYIYIKNMDISQPAEINVKIERTGDPTAEIVVTHKIAAVTETFTEQDEQAGKTFHFAPTNGSATVVERDGTYYITVGGNEYELHAAITKDIRGVGYSFSDIETKGDDNPASGDTPTSNGYLTVYEDLTKRDVDWNYTQFIAQYSQHCNSVGTYKLNAELKTFLERYLNQRGSEIYLFLNISVAPGCNWLLGCGYYA